MNRKLVVIILVLLLAGAFYFWLGRLALYYQEKNAAWNIHGTVVDNERKQPLGGVQVRVYVRKAITPEHHWRTLPIVRTNFTVTTDVSGHFSIEGTGGSVDLRIETPGYQEADWSGWARADGADSIRTNVILALQPKEVSTNASSAQPPAPSVQ
jgi:hypothetical protein